MRKSSVALSVAGLCLIVAVFAVAFAGDGERKDPNGRADDERPRIFTGLVVDESGNPAGDGEADVQADIYGNNPIIPGGRIPLREKQRNWTVYFKGGNLLVQIPHDADLFTINAIRVNGTDWLNDQSWNYGGSRSPRDNREYWMWQYVPDVNRPAVFVVVRTGAKQVTTKPSRGGSDRRAEDHKVIPNEATAIRIPTTGPGAPQNTEERIRAIEKYARDKANGLYPND